MKKTFILSLGAPRCGTTWLFHYLNSRSNVNFGNTKEYHYWDTRDSVLERYPEYEKYLPSFSSQVDYEEGVHRGLEEYLDHFDEIIERGAEITGDLTPSYCLMEADELRAAREAIKARGYDIKLIFTMRDPVERSESWFAFRFQFPEMKCHWSEWAEWSGMGIPEFLKDYKTEKNDAIGRMGRYDLTIQAIKDAGFTKDEVKFFIMEEFFTKEKVDELSEWLGVESDYSALSFVVNDVEVDHNFSEKTRKNIRKKFDKTYKFCHNMFPSTKKLWG